MINVDRASFSSIHHSIAWGIDMAQLRRRSCWRIMKVCCWPGGEVVSGVLAEFHLDLPSNQRPEMGWGRGPGGSRGVNMTQLDGGGPVRQVWKVTVYWRIVSTSLQLRTMNACNCDISNFRCEKLRQAVDCWLCVARPSTPLYHSLLHCGWKQKFSRSMTKTGKIVGRNAECWSTSVKCELKKNEFYRNTFPTYVTVSQQADFLNNIWW